MALLTEEQIAELTLVHDKWWDGNENFQEYLIEWNEKQTGTQINVNWDNAPKFADKAVLRLHWVTGGKGSELWTASDDAITLERPEPVITPHPHAEMIAKYAEVAQRRVDPWVEFEARLTYDHRNTWFKMTDDKFFSGTTDFEYRHIGETK